MAARRLFAAPPGASATLAEVARHAGVSRATVHRHFHSRRELLRAVDVEPEPGASDRALAAGIELVARDGLAQLSMDEVAERAGVSRANLYRIFPGKTALFRELIRVYSPLEPIRATVMELRDQPPDVVMPAIARAVARHLEGRVGLVRSLMFEVSAPTSEAAIARELVIETALRPLATYVTIQMRTGTLRRTDVLLALQAFVGPIFFHLVTRPFGEALLGLGMPVEDAAVGLAAIWLAGMRPDTPEVRP